MDNERATPEDIANATNFAAELIDLYEERDAMERELKETNKRIYAIENEGLSSIMEKIGLEEMPLTGNRKIVAKPELKASLPTQAAIKKAKKTGDEDILLRRKEACFAWLRVNGHDSVIKNQIVVELSRKQDNLRSAITSVCEDIGADYEVKSEVHHSTLNALAKEIILTNGGEMPEDLFNIQSGTRAIVK